MKNQTSLVALLLSLLYASGGCSWAASGFDRQVDFEIDEWRDIEQGYLSVDSDPPGAIVSFQAHYTANIAMKVGLKEKHSTTKFNTKGWVVAGSTPVLNFELPRSGQGYDRKNIAAKADGHYSITKLSLRFEMQGYETVEIERTVLRPSKTETPYLTVKMVPEESDQKTRHQD